ncbi:hypothetical protein CCMA1212_003531 [Trichoderma ghanense]|uniref:Uncharacterized protein n=1 Tax=Trichoderma ghanense TaxID=65468 RepID=A0ABY2H8G2_9HYPO
MLADCNQSQTARFWGAGHGDGTVHPNAISESQISCALVCMHVRKAPVKYYSVRGPAKHVHAQQTVRAQNNLHGSSTRADEVVIHSVNV